MIKCNFNCRKVFEICTKRVKCKHAGPKFSRYGVIRLNPEHPVCNELNLLALAPDQSERARAREEEIE